METTSVYAHVLKATAYTASKLRVVLFSKEYGKVVVWARSGQSKKIHRKYEPFTELVWLLNEKSGCLYLQDVELLNIPLILPQQAIISAWYLNELLMHVLAEGESDAILYEFYKQTLLDIANLELDSRFYLSLEQILRRFEWRLLYSIGYGISLTTDLQQNQPIQADKQYKCVLKEGFVEDSEAHLGIYGFDLLALYQGLPVSPHGLKKLKLITRGLIDDVLDGKTLVTRELFKKIHGKCNE